jgi:F0F1-type ATP synthase gamma subunit
MTGSKNTENADQRASEPIERYKLRGKIYIYLFFQRTINMMQQRKVIYTILTMTRLTTIVTI